MRTLGPAKPSQGWYQRGAPNTCGMPQMFGRAGLSALRPLTSPRRGHGARPPGIPGICFRRLPPRHAGPCLRQLPPRLPPPALIPQSQGTALPFWIMISRGSPRACLPPRRFPSTATRATWEARRFAVSSPSRIHMAGRPSAGAACMREGLFPCKPEAPVPQWAGDPHRSHLTPHRSLPSHP